MPPSTQSAPCSHSIPRRCSRFPLGPPSAGPHQLHALGQSLWLDSITRELLTRGTLRRYIADLSVTGLTSNPTLFDQAIAHSGFYDEAIRRKTAGGKSGEELFFELAIEDLGQA